MDLHQGQIQGFFNIPVDELTAVHILSNYFKHKHLEDLVVVTDLGFAKRARTFAELLDAPLAIIEKRRVGNLDRAELLNVIGEVRGKRAIIVDDEIDTAGTLIETVHALEREGVTEIYACATHGVLSGPAIDRINALEPARARPDRHGAAAAGKRIAKITTLSIAPLIGEAIKRIHRGESVGALFSSEVEFTQEMLLWEDGIARKLDIRGPARRGRATARPTIGDVVDAAPLARRRGRAIDEPPAPPARRQGRPRARARRAARLPRRSSARRAGAGRSRAAGCRRSGTRRCGPTSRCIVGAVLARPRVRDVRGPRARLRHRGLALPGLTLRRYDAADDPDWADAFL